MKALVLAFAGRIASGKSTVSQKVASTLGWPWTSFGEFLRREAVREGLDPSSRKALQELGQKFIDSGWERFCRSVLRAAHWQRGQPLVIDGIRHAEAVETLKRFTAPVDVKLVFVATEEGVRRGRFRVRKEGEDLNCAERHAVEIQSLETLPRIADFTIDGSLPEEECVAIIVAWVKDH